LLPVSLTLFAIRSMPFNRTTLLAGAFAGIGTALWTLFEFTMGWHTTHIEVGAKTGFVGVFFPLLAILWALRATKARTNGQLTLKQALLVGLSVALVLAGIGVVFYQIYYSVINPDFLTRLRAAGTPTDTESQLITVVVGSIGFSLLVALLGGLAMRSGVDAPQR